MAVVVVIKKATEPTVKWKDEKGRIHYSTLSYYQKVIARGGKDVFLTKHPEGRKVIGKKVIGGETYYMVEEEVRPTGVNYIKLPSGRKIDFKSGRSEYTPIVWTKTKEGKWEIAKGKTVIKGEAPEPNDPTKLMAWAQYVIHGGPDNWQVYYQQKPPEPSQPPSRRSSMASTPPKVAPPPKPTQEEIWKKTVGATPEEIQKDPAKYGYKIEKIVVYPGVYKYVYTPIQPKTYRETSQVPAYIDVGNRIIYVTSRELAGKEVKVQTPEGIQVFRTEYSETPRGEPITLTLTREYKAPSFEVTEIDEYEKKKAEYIAGLEKFHKEKGILGDIAVVYSTAILSPYDPLGLRTIYTAASGILSGKKPEEIRRELMEIRAEALMSIEDLRSSDWTKKAGVIIKSPGAQVGITAIGGYVIGTGVGAISRVAPTFGKIVQAGLVGAGIGSAAASVHAPLKSGDVGGAVASAGMIAVTLPAAGMYKAGYKAGWTWASKKWVQTYRPVTLAEVQKKVVADTHVKYEGSYKTIYKPSAEAKPVKIVGRFETVEVKKPTIIMAEEGRVVQLEKGVIITRQTGTAYVGGKEVPVEGYSITGKVPVGEKLDVYRTISVGRAGHEYYIQTGVSVSPREPIDVIKEPVYKDVTVQVRYVKRLLAQGILGRTYIGEGVIELDADLVKNPKLHAKVLKHEILHQLYPTYPERKIIFMENVPEKMADVLVKQYFETGKLAPFKQYAGQKTIHVYGSIDVGAGISTAGRYRYMGVTIVKDVAEVEIIKGVAHYRGPSTVITETVQLPAERIKIPIDLSVFEPKPSSSKFYVSGRGIAVVRNLSAASRRTYIDRTRSTEFLRAAIEEKGLSRIGFIPYQDIFQKYRETVQTIPKEIVRTRLRTRTKPAVKVTTQQVLKTDVTTRTRTTLALRSLLSLRYKLQTITQPIEFTPSLTLYAFWGSKAKPSHVPKRRVRVVRFRFRLPKRLAVKTILSDPLSVMISRIRYGRATHPAPTPRVWRIGEQSLFMFVPTAEMIRTRRRPSRASTTKKRKRYKRRRR